MFILNKFISLFLVPKIIKHIAQIFIVFFFNLIIYMCNYNVLDGIRHIFCKVGILEYVI